MNVKFILRNFRKNVDFCGFTVHGAIKYSINPYECQIYFFAIHNLLYQSVDAAEMDMSVGFNTTL